MAAPLTAKFNMTLHWIPSHLDFGYGIAGNEAADVLASAAARESRRQDHVNPNKSLGSMFVHKCLRHEAARLVHNIEQMFPRDDQDDNDSDRHDPTASPCAVPMVAPAAGGKSGGVDGAAI